MQRRTFLKAVGSAVAMGCAGDTDGDATRQIESGLITASPNILVLMVDQMRGLEWIPASVRAALMPNLTRLLNRSAVFSNHFTVSTACTPARSAIVTGLYTHQSGMFQTNKLTMSQLDARVPTYGTALRSLGYETRWCGKWHLGSLINVSLDDHGFSGGGKDPGGFPNEGRQDGDITAEFLQWFARRSQSSTGKPWCTTVSFVNPHDIAFFPELTESASEYQGPFSLPDGWLDDAYFENMGGLSCANFEDPNAWSSAKPKIQQLTANSTFLGPGITWDPSSLASLPKGTKEFSYWLKLLRLYSYMHHKVDVEIGRVLDALDKSPFRDNTVVVFTADHGEHGGAHGLVGKGATAYEEAIKVPLAVYDPTGRFVRGAGVRTQLTSSVDLFGLLVTLGNGGNDAPIRTGAYAYLSKRLALHTLLADRNAKGRSAVLYATDEYFPEFKGVNFHLATVRTAQGKLTTYSSWKPSSMSRRTDNEELEVYDYRRGDFREVDNVARTSDLTKSLYEMLHGPGGLFERELRGAVPAAIATARDENTKRYLGYAG